MIAAINQITGRTDCGEAVMLAQRPAWAFPVGVVVFIAVFLGLQAADVNGIIAGAAAGGLLGGVVAGLSQNYLLGYCDGTVVLARSSRWSVKAVVVVAQWGYPVPASVTTGRLINKVTIGDQTYQLAKQLDARFRSITGTPQTAS